MSVEIRRVDGSHASEWDALVRRTERANPFYLFDALELQADDTDTTLHALVGVEDGAPIGLFPVFELQRGPMTGAFSPPPKSWSISLGPLLVGDDAEPRERRRRSRAFARAAFDWIGDHLEPQYQQFHVAGYDDVRPFEWRGYEVVPQFTYVVELTDEDDLLANFSRDARQNVRNADDARFTIEEAGSDAVRYIVEQVRERHRAQDIPFQLDPEFAASLFRRLPDGALRPYVCRVDGSRVGGLLVLEHGDTVYRWQGGVKPDGDTDLPINDLLDWHVMREATRRGLARYDLVGAGNPSINRYKAKFGPELEANYTARKATTGVRTLVDLYSRAHFLETKLRGALGV